MDGFGVTILLKSTFDCYQNERVADVCARPAPMLKGEQGAKLQKQVWPEIVNALKKDVPEVQSLVKA
jgi:hypothetical protein